MKRFVFVRKFSLRWEYRVFSLCAWFVFFEQIWGLTILKKKTCMVNIVIVLLVCTRFAASSKIYGSFQNKANTFYFVYPYTPESVGSNWVLFKLFVHFLKWTAACSRSLSKQSVSCKNCCYEYNQLFWYQALK